MASDGTMPVDRSGLRPEVRALLEAIDRDPGPPLAGQTPAIRRALADVSLPSYWGEREEVASVRDLVIPVAGGEVRARLYRPDRPEGTILFLHGGGWVVGSIETHDSSCRTFARRASCDVVSVEYRKAPEFPFPAAVGDAGAAIDWVIANGGELGIDTRHLVLAGDSAGANLAAVAARHARDRGIRLGGQVLVYPATDMAAETATYDAFADGFFLSAEAIRWFLGHYVPEPAHRLHPDASPIRAADLRHLAPALVITAAFDPLRDEGRAYAARMIEAGNDVDYREWPGVIHGFWIMSGVTPAAIEAIDAAGAWVRARLKAARTGG